MYMRMERLWTRLLLTKNNKIFGPLLVVWAIFVFLATAFPNGR